MLRIIFTITIQQVFSTCSENIMSFVYIFFIQQMIFCMSEFAVKEYQEEMDRESNKLFQTILFH